MALNINRDKFQERSDDIRKYMAKLHSATKEGTSPSNKEIAVLGKKFYERDKDVTKSFDLEMSHVIRGFEWGVKTMRQILVGNDLPIRGEGNSFSGTINWVKTEDRLPEQHDTVLTFGTTNEGGVGITICRHSDGVFRFWESGKENKHHITHWTKLPNHPPNEKDEGFCLASWLLH